MGREQVARGLIGGYITLRYLKEMEDNYRKGDWLEAAKDTGWFAIAIAPVVAPRFFFGAVAYPVVVGATLGLTATAVILEVTGLGEWEDVVELIVDPPSPKEFYKVVAPAIREEITEPIIDYVVDELWQKQLVEPIGGWLSRRERDIRKTWEMTRPRAPSWL